MSTPYICCLIQLLLLCRGETLHKTSNLVNIHHGSFESSKESEKLLCRENSGPDQKCSTDTSSATFNVQSETIAEEIVQRVRRKTSNESEKIRDFNITGVFWSDVWKSSEIKWVAKRVDNKEIRPSDRQFFHTLIPDATFGLRDICVNFDQKDERDFTLLANISWKDREPSLRYPPVPPQCTFGRSSGFLCVLLDDSSSCHYVSGWGQDRVQALVNGRLSNCGPRQQLRMMLHALGLMHEHDRGDALQFIRLHPRLRVLARPGDPIEYRIPQDNCSLFRQNSSSLPFDFASIMLHDGWFQIDSAQMDFELPLIPKSPRDLRELFVDRKPGLSHYDRLKLHHLYGCRSKNCSRAPPCEHFGFRNKLCQCECAPGYAGKRCELIRKPTKDPCLRTVTHTSSFTLNGTKCLPTSQQPFNFTIQLTGPKSNRFVIMVDMTPVRAVLETLRILPNCEHARLYFTGMGEARPQVVCAERLVLSPVTLRTIYSSGSLFLLVKLPKTPQDPGRPDPATAAIRAIRVDISSEPSPASELHVDTSKPPPTNTTISTTVTTELPTPFTESTEQPPPTQSPLTTTATRPSTRPTKKTQMEVLPSMDLGEAHKAAGSSTRKAAIILTVIIVSVLIGTVALVSFMLRFHREDPDELEFEQLQNADLDEEESAAMYDEGQQQKDFLDSGATN